MKKILMTILMGVLFSSSALAAGNLTMNEVIPCNIQYGGDGCIWGIEVSNNTGQALQNATLTFSVNGFDGKGIDVFYLTEKGIWNNNEVAFPVSVPIRQSDIEVIINTDVALTPGVYEFTLMIAGNAEKNKIGGGSFTTLSSFMPEESDKLIEKEGKTEELPIEGAEDTSWRQRLIDKLREVRDTLNPQIKQIGSGEQDIKLIVEETQDSATIRHDIYLFGEYPIGWASIIFLWLVMLSIICLLIIFILWKR